MYYEIVGSSVRILGSVHVVPQGEQPTIPRVDQSYRWAQRLCVEHHPHEVMPTMLLPRGRTLEGLIQSQHKEMLKELWPAYPMVPPLLNHKPWAAFIIAAASSLDGVPGVEPAIVSQAAADGKQVHCLETGAGFGAVMDSIPMPTLFAAIDHYARSRDAAKENFMRMHRAWVANDSAALWSVLSEGPFAADPVLHAIMFAARNRSWAPQIIEAAGDVRENLLVIVGAGHLVGPDNLVELLQADGLKLRPLPAD